ncbi:MAG: AAA family ATPase [Candidatus Diapherotrites archaeon]
MGCVMSLQNIFEAEFTKPSVFLDRNKIMPHYTPQNLPFREEQTKFISNAVAVTLRGQRPDNLFIYGKPGTGKTSTTRHVMAELCSFAKQKELKVRHVYINCRTHNKKYKVLLKSLRELYPDQPDKAFQGYSAAYLYEKLVSFVRETETHLLLILDELDKVRDLDELIYSLTRSNDELPKGGISVIGISNNLLFKDALDPRTKSSLCQQEMVFAPYNANQLHTILEQRVQEAFITNGVEGGAISLASALAAQESGDARTAIKLLLRAGELADEEKANVVTDTHVKRARTSVEQEIILEHIQVLPEQEKLVLYTLACMSLTKKPIQRLSGEIVEGQLFSGEVYEEYERVAKKINAVAGPVSARWYREYINQLEMYGMIVTTASGPGVKGQTRFIKLKVDANKIKDVLEKEFAG